jgi:hypothetical protein
MSPEQPDRCRSSSSASTFWDYLRAWVSFAPIQILVLIVAWGILFLRGLSHVPVQPILLGDSLGYLQAYEIRPHGYPLFLEAYRFVVGDLSYLPHTQWLLLASSSLLLSLAVGWRVNNVLAAGLIVAYLAFRPFTYSDLVMSDPLYEALLVSAAACLVWYFSLSRIWLLAVASALLGMALITRTIGYSIVPVFAICVALSYRSGQQVRRSVVIIAATLPFLIWCAIGAGSNLLRYGHFRIGSHAGQSLVGKGLLLAQPLSGDNRFNSVDWVPELVLPARKALASIHDVVLKALIIRQYYEVLRFDVVFPRFDERLPGWHGNSAYEHDRFERSLAIEYIRNDLRGYGRLVALDYLSLWALPHLLTANEHEFLEHSYRSLGPLPFLAEFEAAHRPLDDYYQVVPLPSMRRQVLVIRAANIAFLIASAALALMLVNSTSRNQLLERGVDALFLTGCVHASYLATALVEGGLERYTAPTWPLMIAAIILVMYICAQNWPGSARVRTHPPGGSTRPAPQAIRT